MINLNSQKNRIYYSQNREDLILDAFFPDVEKGFYVDIGAYDPEEDSATKLFYLKGWRGINVEPQAARHEFFEVHRKRDVNLNVGVDVNEGTLKLRSYKNQGLSTFSEEMKNIYKTKPVEGGTETYTDVEVTVKPLSKIFKECKVNKIHFMKIDVEGYEGQVLRSNDWKKYRPEVLCIEANHIINDWEDELYKNNYGLVFFDGLNKYYADASTNRKGTFDYVNHIVLERGGGLSFNDFNNLAKGNQKISELNKVIASADVELTKKADRNSTLKQQVDEMKGVRNATNHLIQQIKIFIKREHTR